VCDIAATKIRSLYDPAECRFCGPISKPFHLGTSQPGEMFDTHDLNGDTDALHHMAGYKGLSERVCARAVELIKQLKP
jgi:hypothetical protein